MAGKLVIVCILFCVLGSCKSPEARRPVSTTTGSFIKESIQRNKNIYRQEADKINTLINKDSTIQYITSDNGFWYYYNTKDSISSVYPKVGNLVSFTYDIKRLNGKVVVSKEENGLQNYRIDQTNQDLISGIREGLKLMKQGETVTFLFPSYKAYGYYGIKNKLATNTPIQSTITLKTIETSEN